MKLNILIVSKYDWKSREKKHAEIRKLMMAGGGIEDVTFTVVRADLGKPDVDADGRITFQWFTENVTRLAGGYTHVIFQFSNRDKRKWGIKRTLVGSNFNDTNRIGEAWVCADERSIFKMKVGESWDKYVKTVAHEVGHQLTRNGDTNLEVHDFDYMATVNNLPEFYRQITKKKLTRPLLQWTVTQGYGVPDAVTYPQTGHHIGTDFRAKIGDGVFAPEDCEVTRTGYSSALGYWCEVKLDGWYMVAMHLRSRPTLGRYKQGWLVATIGNTGMINGVHSHLEAWHGPMNRAVLTKDNFRKLTFDITTKFQ